jgi:hypothetical protein
VLREEEEQVLHFNRKKKSLNANKFTEWIFGHFGRLIGKIFGSLRFFWQLMSYTWWEPIASIC